MSSESCLDEGGFPSSCVMGYEERKKPVGGAGGELGLGAPQLALQIMDDINLVHCRMNLGPATCIRSGLFQ